jgi:peptidyl-prolyl cis-trans isomerase A (cyclophilin A)
LSACGGGGGGDEDSTPVATPSAILVSLSASGNAIANLPVQLSATPSGPAGQTVAQSNWNYGDGQSGTSSSHAYGKAGTYTVTYDFTDSKGLKGQGTTKVTVKACSGAGLAAAAASPTTTNVCVQTSEGEMVFALDPVKAPLSTNNFMAYVKDGFYSSTVVHRVEKDPNFWVIQGGLVGKSSTGLFLKTPTYASINLESQNGLLNKRYTLGMARSDDPNSATSQFYINLVDTPVFDYSPGVRDGYAVFGKIIHGTDVADAMGNVAVGTNKPFNKFPTTLLVYIGMTPM